MFVAFGVIAILRGGEVTFRLAALQNRQNINNRQRLVAVFVFDSLFVNVDGTDLNNVP